MTPGERFKQWIDSLAEAWGKRLRDWMASWFLKGVEDTFEDLEPEVREQLAQTIQLIEEAPGLPSEYKALINRLRTHKSPVWLIPLLIGLGSMIFGAVASQMTPTLSGIHYYFSRVAKIYRLDPLSVITAWRRDPKTYEVYFEDLKDQGWSDDRIEALKFITQFYPAPADLINWQAKEVFEPLMIERYGLDSEFEEIEKAPFYKAGMTDEQILNYWRAHWQHASWMQVVEMLHRGQLKEEEVWDWFRLVEIPPFWRDKLIAISWNVPTRVDIRRFLDMGTIDEARLTELYTNLGYHGKDLADYVLWTKVYNALPDLLARWTKGWLTIDDVRSELLRLGMPEAKIEEVIQTKVKPAQPERVEEGKALTKSEIYKGVKAGIISREEGLELLVDLNYSEAEAEYLLDINVTVLAGSPETFAEFKDITQKYKLATGKEVKPMPEELKAAATEVVRLTKDVESLRLAVAEEAKKLITEEVLPQAATAKRDELQVSLHRAESALAATKVNYDSLLAQWRHGG